jgi:integrase
VPALPEIMPHAAVAIDEAVHEGQLNACHDRLPAGSRPTRCASRTTAGTVAAVVGMYLASAAFAGLADETRRTRRNILERFREAHGDKRIASIERKHVQALIDAKAATPSAARNLLAAIRLLMQFAIDAGIRADDPTLGVKRVKIKTDGYATWTEDDIAAFERRHPPGTMPRLALALLLGTGQRRSDVVRMGRQHVRGDLIAVRQQKTGEPLMIPIGDELRAAIDAVPADRLIFLTTARGEPFTAAGFTNYFRKRCKEAGLSIGLSAHGLRKAMCRRLAEAGCTEKMIAAISGHRTLRMVQRYTDAADQERLARAAIERLGNDRATNREGSIHKPPSKRLKLQGSNLAMVGLAADDRTVMSPNLIILGRRRIIAPNIGGGSAAPSIWHRLRKRRHGGIVRAGPVNDRG